MLDPEGPLSYILIFLFILISAFFAGSESAFSYCNRYKIKVWADDGIKRAKVAMNVIEKFDDAIITILIATNVLHISTSIIATIVAVALMGENGGVVSTIVITILVFMFSEIIPKNIAKANSDKWALNSAIIVKIFMILFFPIIFIFDCMIKLFKKIIGSKTREDNFTDDDFQNIIGKISEEGAIDEEESEIIIAAVDFGEKVVSEVLTKREEIVALDINKCSNKFLKKYLLEVSYSRIPVYQGSIDNIIGILHVRNYLKALWQNGNIRVKECLMVPYIVSPKIKLDEMFEGFKQHKTHIAIVCEKNKTIGMVTMKDVLEELVSDIDEVGTSDEMEGSENA